MIHKLNKIDTVRSIDSILHTPQNTVYSKGDTEGTRPEPQLIEEKAESKDSFSRDQLKDMVEEAKKVMNGINHQITFKIHEKTGRQLVQLVDKETQNVIREIPPEKMLDVLAGIWEWAGLVVDRKE